MPGCQFTQVTAESGAQLKRIRSSKLYVETSACYLTYSRSYLPELIISIQCLTPCLRRELDFSCTYERNSEADTGIGKCLCELKVAVFLESIPFFLWILFMHGFMANILCELNISKISLNNFQELWVLEVVQGARLHLFVVYYISVFTDPYEHNLWVWQSLL